MITRLSPNFALAEFTRNSHGFKNEPPEGAIRALMALCVMVLEPVREHFQSPVIIPSGYRGKELNKAVGGSLTSQHVKGEAADFMVKGIAHDVVVKWIAANLTYDQLIAEKLSKTDGMEGWIHCSYSTRSENRKELLSFLHTGRYVRGLVYAS